MFTFEKVINPALLNVTGNAHLHEGPSTSGLPSAPPVNIIQTDQALRIHFVWRQNAPIARIIDGVWKYRVYFEKMGAGEVPSDFPSSSTPFIQAVNASYSQVITVPANTLKPGVYKLVATLMLCGKGGAPTPIAGYDELGILEVYND